jgi:hypothetical protein
MPTKPQLRSSTASPDFVSVLDTPSNEVSRPKPLAQGTYVWQVHGLPRIDKSTKKGTEFSEYTCQALEACEDVDGDELKYSLTKPSGEMIALKDRSQRITFYHTEDAVWRLKKFLDDLQVPEEDDEGKVRSLRQRMQDVPGKIFYGHIKHSPSDDGETMYANIDKTAKYEG